MAVRAIRTQARTFAKPAALQGKPYIHPTFRLMHCTALTKIYHVIADLVQELYLKELRAYKAPPVKSSDAEGHVQNFRLPKAPASPEEQNLANDLKAYETAAVEVEGQVEDGNANAQEEDWFEEEPEEEAPAGGH